MTEVEPTLSLLRNAVLPLQFGFRLATYRCALHFSFFFFLFFFFLCNVYVQPVEFWQTWSVFTIHNLPDFMPLISSNFARSCRNKCATFGLPSPEFIQGGFHLLGRFPFPFRLRLPRPFYFSYSCSLLSIIQTDCGKDYECTISALEARLGLEKVVVCICSEPFTQTAHFPDELTGERTIYGPAQLLDNSSSKWNRAPSLVAVSAILNFLASRYLLKRKPTIGNRWSLLAILVENKFIWSQGIIFIR